ncbi:autotransporter domain-containing protein, partial [Bradyrhizobium sp. AUGA SZCCT0169]|uniref:autotransporter family protein n=1 Tax=Bradyrhizobium sp. AUGA SZCCT0169 TaxID=2807663 RepID=UPI001BADB804
GATGGQLIKTGTGTLNLAGNNIYTGNTTVDAGTLLVNGSIASSALTTVNAGATLGGTGTVGNLTIAGGTLAPGNSIGTLSVQGSLVFTAAATYLIEISPTNSDLTNVTGSATLGGATVSAIYANGAYVARRYTIVNAAGGVNGTFGSVVNTNLPAGFVSSLSYDAQNAYLDLNLTFSPGFANGLNGNQTAVANALINSFNTTGGIPLVFGTLTPAGLTQVSGEAATGTQQTTFDAMDKFINVMTDPFTGTRSGGAPPAGATGYADENEALAYAARKGRNAGEREAYAKMVTKAPPLSFERRWSVWGAGYGGSQSTDGNAAVGSNSYTSRIYGGAAGLDYRIAPSTLVGFSLGGAGTKYDLVNGLGGGRSEMFQAGVYGRHDIGAAYLAGALAYGWQDVTTDRIALLNSYRAKFDANALSGRLEGGYRYAFGTSGLTPYAAGQFTTLWLPNYTEQVVAGVNTFALSYAERNVTAPRTELGLRADTS